VSGRDHEASIMRGPWPTRSCCTIIIIKKKTEIRRLKEFVNRMLREYLDLLGRK